MAPRSTAISAQASNASASPKPSAPTPAVPPPPPSPLILRLRQDWRWAAISQFCAMFLPTLGGIDWDSDRVEDDFDNTETAQIPAICTGLLSALTLDRKINIHNHLDHLRKQYKRRSPDTNKLGTLDEPVPWEEIGLGDKLQVLWDLCEWHMADPERFRGLVNEGGAVNVEIGWRINPVGWDATGNTYFLFDDNRLWVQHPPPAPPKPKTPKVKKAPPKKAPAKSTPKPKAKSKGKAAVKPPPSPPSPPLLPRSSKRAPSSTVLAAAPPPPPAKKSRSTRASRGTVEEVWQDIPAEWLQPVEPDVAGPSGSSSTGPALKGTGLLSDDDDSDLSDVSDAGEDDDDGDLTPVEDGDEPSPAPESVIEPEEVEDQEEEEEEAQEEEEEEQEEEEELEEPASELVRVDEFEAARAYVPDYLEWEAVCVCRYDWETFPERFANSSNIDEQNFYEYLVDVVQPQVTAVFREREATKKLEDAIRNRKRSSRLQLIESQKEEQERLEAARQATDARLDRVRKEEAQKKMEEDAHRATEQARIDRLREREERAALREEQARLAREREEAANELEAKRREERQMIRNGELPPDYVLTGDEPPKQEEVAKETQPQPAPSVPAPEAKPAEPARKASVKTSSLPALESIVVKKRSHKKGQGKAATAAAAAAAANEGRWILNCEICKTFEDTPLQHGPITCCEKCNQWQHTNCHDQFAVVNKIPKRNWKKDSFICASCIRKIKPKGARKPLKPTKPQSKPKATTSIPSGSKPVIVNAASSNAGPSIAASSASSRPKQVNGSTQALPLPPPPPSAPAARPPPSTAIYAQQQHPYGPQSGYAPAPQQYYQNQLPRGYYAPPSGAAPAAYGFAGQPSLGIPTTYGSQPYYGAPPPQQQPSYAGYPQHGQPFAYPQQGQPSPPLTSPYGHSAHDTYRSTLPTSVSSERGSVLQANGIAPYGQQARPPPLYASPQMGQPTSPRPPMHPHQLSAHSPFPPQGSPYVPAGSPALQQQHASAFTARAPPGLLQDAPQHIPQPSSAPASALVPSSSGQTSASVPISASPPAATAST